MSRRRIAAAEDLAARVFAYSQSERGLPGIAGDGSALSLGHQIVDSIRRIEFVARVRARPISPQRSDPSNVEMFDPVRAAILASDKGDVDEAAWLVFLLTHFGRHRRGGWRLVREVYGGLGADAWRWPRISQNVRGFRDWLHRNNGYLRRSGAGFGPHRNRESLDARSPNGTGAVVESYVSWACDGHEAVFGEHSTLADGDPGDFFDRLYHSMDAVHRFGRLARFDYLTMLGKIGLVDALPSIPYLRGSSGPRSGAKLLFGSGHSVETLDALVRDLGESLGVGMQVMEDALCNWQKSPSRYKRFSG